MDAQYRAGWYSRHGVEEEAPSQSQAPSPTPALHTCKGVVRAACDAEQHGAATGGLLAVALARLPHLGGRQDRLLSLSAAAELQEHRQPKAEMHA